MQPVGPSQVQSEPISLLPMPAVQLSELPSVFDDPNQLAGLLEVCLSDKVFMELKDQLIVAEPLSLVEQKLASLATVLTQRIKNAQQYRCLLDKKSCIIVLLCRQVNGWSAGLFCFDAKQTITQFYYLHPLQPELPASWQTALKKLRGYTSACIQQLPAQVAGLTIVNSGIWLLSHIQMIIKQGKLISISLPVDKEQQRYRELLFTKAPLIPLFSLPINLARQLMTYQQINQKGQTVLLSQYEQKVQLEKKLITQSTQYLKEYTVAYKKADAINTHDKFRYALAIRLDVLGAEDKSVIEMLKDIANIYEVANYSDIEKTIERGLQRFHQRRYDKALDCYRTALAMIKATSDDQHPRMVDVWMNMGNVFSEQRDYLQALACHQKALVVMTKTFGPTHYRMSGLLTNIGIVYRRYIHSHAKTLRGSFYAKRFVTSSEISIYHQTARNYFKSALEIAIAAVGWQHPKVAIISGNLAILDQDRGEFSLALQQFQWILSIQTKALARKHADVPVDHIAFTQHQIAETYLIQGDYLNALQYQTLALDSFNKSSLGEFSSEACEIRRSIAFLERELALQKAATNFQGATSRLDNAQKQLQALYDQHQPLLTDPQKIRTLYDLAYYDQLLKDLARVERYLGHPETVYTLYLQEAQRWQSRFPALAWRYTTKAKRELAFLPLDQQRAAELWRLQAKIYADQGRWPRALQALAQIDPLVSMLEDEKELKRCETEWKKERTVLIEEDCVGQWQRCLDSRHDIELLLFKCMSRGEPLSHQVKNYITELIIKLRNLLDQAMGRFTQRCLYEANDIKSRGEKDRYFPFLSSKKALDKSWRKAHFLRPHYIPMLLLKKHLTLDRRKHILPHHQQILDALVAKNWLTVELNPDNKTETWGYRVVPGGDLTAITLKALDIVDDTLSDSLMAVITGLQKAENERRSWLSLDEEPLKPAYEALLRHQAFHNYSVEANREAQEAKDAKEHPPLWERCWLDTVIAIGNDSKHIRLTPQHSRESLMEKRGLLQDRQLHILIEYIEPEGLVYSWSFVSCLFDVTLMETRLQLSQRIYHQLRHSGQLSIGDQGLITVNQTGCDLFLGAVRARADASVLVTHYQTYKEEITSVLQPIQGLTPEQIDRITKALLRRAPQAAHLSFVCDRELDIDVLLKYGLEGVYDIITTLGRVRRSLSPSTPLPFDNKQTIAPPGSTLTTQTLGDLHTQWQVCEQKATEALRAHDVASALQYYVTDTANVPSWLQSRYQQRITWLAGVSLKTQPTREQALLTRATQADTQKLLVLSQDRWAKTVSHLRNTHKDQKDYQPHVSQEEQVTTRYNTWQRQNDFDLFSQLEHARENSILLCERVWWATRTQAHPLEHAEIENRIAELMLKIRHLLDQSITRWINHCLRPPQGPFSQHQFPVRGSADGLKSWAKEHDIKISDPFPGNDPVWLAILACQPIQPTTDTDTPWNWLTIVKSLSDNSKHHRLPCVNWQTLVSTLPTTEFERQCYIEYRGGSLSARSFLSSFSNNTAAERFYEKLLSKPHYMPGKPGQKKLAHKGWLAYAKAVVANKSVEEKQLEANWKKLREELSKQFADVLDEKSRHSSCTPDNQLDGIMRVLLNETHRICGHDPEVYALPQTVLLFPILDTALTLVEHVLIEICKKLPPDFEMFEKAIQRMIRMTPVANTALELLWEEWEQLYQQFPSIESDLNWKALQELQDFIFAQELQKAFDASQTARPREDLRAALAREAKHAGLTCQNVNGDGNCCFHAFAHQLYVLEGKDTECKRDLHGIIKKEATAQRADALRALAVKELKEHREDYEPVFLEYKRQVEEMSRSGTWVDETAIKLLVNALARQQGRYLTVVLVTNRQDIIQVFRAPGATDIITVGCEIGHHYQSLMPEAKEVKPGQPTELLSTIAEEDLKGAKIVKQTVQLVSQLRDYQALHHRTQTGEIGLDQQITALEEKIKQQLSIVYPNEPGINADINRNINALEKMTGKNVAQELELHLLKTIKEERSKLNEVKHPAPSYDDPPDDPASDQRDGSNSINHPSSSSSTTSSSSSSSSSAENPGQTTEQTRTAAIEPLSESVPELKQLLPKQAENKFSFLPQPGKIHSAVTERGFQIDFFVTASQTIYAEYKKERMKEKDIFFNISLSPDAPASFQSLAAVNMSCQQKIEAIKKISKASHIALSPTGSIEINCFKVGIRINQVLVQPPTA